MPTAAFLIYSGIMPLIKTYFTIFFGYFLAKRDLFPPAASRGASQVTMNISLPALVFANIVPAFTPQNISALGPLFLTAFVYMSIGFSAGVLIREVFYVPRNFWQGIVVLTGMSNWGNLPNAIVLSVTAQAPFNPATDPQLGVSFVSIFIVSYHLVFWVAGAAHSLSWDYLPGVPQGEEAERRHGWKEKPLGSLFARYILRKPGPPTICKEKNESDEESRSASPIEKSEERVEENTLAVPPDQAPHRDDVEVDPDIQLVRRTSRLSTVSYRSRHPSLPIPQDSSRPPLSPSPPPSLVKTLTSEPCSPPKRSIWARLIPPVVIRTLRPLSVVVTPVTVAIAVSLPIALVNDLKALFVDISNDGGPDWKAPDGNPPLAFVIDTASFVGDMAVPLALILLGASFARLRIPRPISRLPIMAMIAVALMKMAILPVIGVFMVQAMVHGGLIDRDAKAEKFVAMFLSGTPAAVNQLIVSSLYAPEGDVDTLSAFLLIQYTFMFISSSSHCCVPTSDIDITLYYNDIYTDLACSDVHRYSNSDTRQIHT
ncbi:hypothetical protein NM688_g2340 [Phlebia brevispora]|uniref:Uncharacterized protein n=1 Tax=Phlebia brevispora TaxID=194682 RepID=A0ACC1T993_9APHY|nr:hypothetical protein NM688_g2340 [Phlebia brevispora]